MRPQIDSPPVGWLRPSNGVGSSAVPASGAVADLTVVPPGTDTPRHAIVGGRVVVENGVLKTGDIEQIRAEANEQARKLWQRMAEIT